VRRFPGICVIAGILLIPRIVSCARTETPVDDAAAADPSFLPARVLYRTHCGACHGRDGRGATHLFPPLRGSEWAVADPEIPIRIVLHGIQGLILVRGERYLNHMMPLGHRLSDEEIADILTYVRASWGNRGSAITPGQVQRVRAAFDDRDATWSPEELAPLDSTTAVSADSAGSGPGGPGS